MQLPNSPSASERPPAGSPPYYSQRFCTARQTFVHAAAGLARVLVVSSAKNQARSGKHLPAVASSCVHPQTAQRTHVSSTHTRTFAGTHLKTRRIVRLCIITLCTAASRRISAHPRPPTRPIGRPLQPFFEISFQTVWTIVGFSTGFGREFYARILFWAPRENQK